MHFGIENLLNNKQEIKYIFKLFQYDVIFQCNWLILIKFSFW